MEGPQKVTIEECNRDDNNWKNDKMDQCKYLNNYAPTPSLTQQQTINDMLDNVGLGEE